MASYGTDKFVMDTRITLLKEVSGGSQDAWTELTEIYQPLIANWLRGFDLQQSDADDLTQEVLTALFSNVDRFGHNGRIGAFRSWLRTVTHNQAVDFLRRRTRDAPQLDRSTFSNAIESLLDPRSSVSKLFDRQHDRHLLRTLLRRVTAEFQDSTMALFREHVIESRDATAIADEFSVSRHAVYMAKSRVMRRLRELAPGLIEDMERNGRC